MKAKKVAKKSGSRVRPAPRPRAPRLAWSEEGLLPAIARDAKSGAVLVLAFVDREALRKTLRTRLVHFWSRKREALWLKGETSGNVFRLVAAFTDCDRDAVLFDVEPAGPACHTGATSCFFERVDEGGVGAPPPPARFGWSELHSLVLTRKREKPRGSATSKLLGAGVETIARKVAEESSQTIAAARKGEPSLFIGEVADLVYTVTVLMAAVGVTPAQVEELLRERHEVAAKGARPRRRRR
jgi:phosphoribosyl-ATP pyrophosphohydrolase/phosphoribosyl-AMP cyclohydrolase